MTSCAAGCPTPRSPRSDYTAFTSKKGQAITARLIVRRVKDLNRKAAEGQDELFPVWRYHAVFTDSPFVMLQAEEQHRDHAVVEQVFADWTDGPLAHLPSGSFPANAAWLALAAISHNLLRAAGSLASLAYAKARGATLRRDLIDVAARTARHGRGHITLHLPEGWHRETEWMNLFEAACGPPAAGRPDQPRPGHRAPTAPAATRQTASQDPRQDLWTSRRKVSGRKATPAATLKITSSVRPAERHHLNSRGGLRLRKKRDFMARDDEQFITFDSLRPNRDFSNFVTLSMTANGPVLHAVPPSFTTGPPIMEIAKVIRNPRRAIYKTETWDDARKAHVVERWLHWQRIAETPEELAASSMQLGE